MNSPTLDRLIQRGKSGILTIYEQAQIVAELEIYRAMSMRLERCVHDLVKEAEI